ncbi:hypothetical protein NSS70_08835 [Aeribacillus sp. FSL K6-2848]|uniref:hypothetical protein n=1 Tax=unclassified Aeribacillus TaxID=2640495 RepID=UPI0030CBF03C
MSRICAFCKSSSVKLTGEHFYPYGLISKFPEFDHAYFGESKAVPLSPEKQVIRDVCEQCNNVTFSKLDEYGNKFILEYFAEEISPQ